MRRDSDHDPALHDAGAEPSLYGDHAGQEAGYPGWAAKGHWHGGARGQGPAQVVQAAGAACGTLRFAGRLTRLYVTESGTLLGNAAHGGASMGDVIDLQRLRGSVEESDKPLQVEVVARALRYFADDIRAGGFGLAADLVLMAVEEMVESSAAQNDGASSK